jgi:ribosomal protein S18 acetylase RimI-like enzyme
VELQESERRLEPTLPAGEAMADDYLAFLFRRCAESSGRILVAEVDRVVAGFAAVLAKVAPEEPDEDPASYAYLTDLVVLPADRRQGIGRELLARAEGWARQAGARTLRVGVLACNRPAGNLYRSLGFREYQLELAKNLSSG